jgi:prepilin-type processing-associated H-X9-DG protein
MSYAGGYIYDFTLLKPVFAFNGNTSPGTPLSEFTNAAETILVGEPPDKATRINGYAMGGAGSAYADSDGDSPGDLHLGGANYLWVDGHVKWMTPDKANLTVNSVTNYYWLRVKP